MVGFPMSLHRVQELHKRIDVALHLCTNCATAFHGEQWGGHIQALMDKPKRRFSVNKQLVVLFPQAVKGMLNLTQKEVCLNVLEQRSTPFDMPFLLSSLTSALTTAGAAGTLITFVQLTLVPQRCLASDFFPVPASNAPEHCPSQKLSATKPKAKAKTKSKSKPRKLVIDDLDSGVPARESLEKKSGRCVPATIEDMAGMIRGRPAIQPERSQRWTKLAQGLKKGGHRAHAVAPPLRWAEGLPRELSGLGGGAPGLCRQDRHLH